MDSRRLVAGANIVEDWCRQIVDKVGQSAIEHSRFQGQVVHSFHSDQVDEILQYCTVTDDGYVHYKDVGHRE